MKILYLHPESYQRRISEVVIPVGVIGMLNMISNDYNVQGINIPLEKLIDLDYSIKDDLRQIDYDIVIIDLHWTVYSYETIELARFVKMNNPNAYIVLGGITASLYYEEILEEFEFIDFIIRGDSEQPLKMLIDGLAEYGLCHDFEQIPNLLFRVGNKIITSKKKYIHNFDTNLDYSSFSWLRHGEEFLKFQSHMDFVENNDEYKLAWIPIARGCRFNCSYCGGNSELFKDIYKYDSFCYRSANDINSDILKLSSKGVTHIGVTHDFSILNSKTTKEVFDFINNNAIDIGCFHYCFQLPKPSFIEQFNATFNQEKSLFGISAICGNEEDRIKQGKCFTNEQLFEALDAFIDTKTKVSIYFIDNYHNDKYDNTYELIQTIKEKYSKKINLEIGYGFEFLQPYSPAYNNKHTENIIPIWNSFKDFYNRFSPNFRDYIRKTKNVEDIIGQKNVNEELLKRYKDFNKLTKSI